MPVEGTIVVDFGDSASDDTFVVVELDDEYNGDKTSFGPKDDVGFIVHYDPGLYKITDVKVSSGSISDDLWATRSRTADVQFVNTEDDVELSYIPSSDVEFEWYAEYYGNEPDIEVDGRDMLALSEVPGIGTATFDIECMPYVLSPPRGLTLGDDETYPVLVVVYMEEV